MFPLSVCNTKKLITEEHFGNSKREARGGATQRKISRQYKFRKQRQTLWVTWHGVAWWVAGFINGLKAQAGWLHLPWHFYNHLTSQISTPNPTPPQSPCWCFSKPRDTGPGGKQSKHTFPFDENFLILFFNFPLVKCLWETR